MGKKAWFSFFGLLLIIGIQCQAGKERVWARDYRINLDLGKARPFEKVALERILPVTIAKEKSERITIDCDSCLTNAAGDQIPFNRMRLAVDDRTFDLEGRSLTVAVNTLSPGTSACRFMLSLELTPADRPGRYQGIIAIKAHQIQPSPVTEIIVQLSVEVQPWVRMETNQRRLVLDQSNGDFKLQNSIPWTIRVASNTSWILSLNLVHDRRIPLECKIIQLQGKGESQTILQPGTILGTERKALAAGNSTVTGEAYWTEIALLLSIADFAKYPAGEHLFQLRILLELWDQKTILAY